MYRNSAQNNKQNQLHTDGSQKHYLNYINFNSNTAQKSSSRDIPREPEQVATYSINVSQHPRSANSNNGNPINRNAYLNATVQPRRQPPRQGLSRNSSNKDPFASRHSEDANSSRNDFLRDSSRTNPQAFNRQSSDLDNSYKPPQSLYGTQQGQMGKLSKTVDIASVHSQNLESSTYTSQQQDEIKQKLNYLEVIEQSLDTFEQSRSAADLRQINEDNRLLMLGVFEQINKLKKQRKRRNNTDCVSESDNFSEEAYSVDDRSEARSNSRYGRNDKRRYMDGLSRSKEKIKAREKELDQQKKVTDKLKAEYESELKMMNSNQQSELQKICVAIQKQEEQMKSIRQSNDQLANKLTNLPFHNEWQIMCAEAQGAKKARIKIEEQIVKRKQKLKETLQASRKTPVKSEETTANQKEDDQKAREGSIDKKKQPAQVSMKLPPQPASRAQFSSGSSNAIPDTSTKPLIPDSRSKSSSRFNTST